MWQNMEVARKAALQAQNLGTFCQQMCAKSEEDNVRIQKDIKQRLEIRVKDVTFWISEVELRIRNVKESIEQLDFLKQRLARDKDYCNHNLKLIQESLTKMDEEETTSEIQYAIKALLTESNSLKTGIGVLNQIIENVKLRIGFMHNVCSVLENELSNQYEELKTDKKSIIGLKHPLVQTEQCQNKIPGKKLSDEVWTGESNSILKYADDHVTISKTLAEQANNALKKLTTTIFTEGNKVTSTLEDIITNVQQQKADLEHHLAMVDNEMSEMTNSEVVMKKALDEKKKSLTIITGQLMIRQNIDDVSRWHPSTSKDNLRLMLQKELAENEKELILLQQNIPELEKTMRSLRRSRLTIVQDISKKLKIIKAIQTKCLNLRDSMKYISNPLNNTIYSVAV